MTKLNKSRVKTARVQSFSSNMVGFGSSGFVAWSGGVSELLLGQGAVSRARTQVKG
jgi:hypothetical protein